MHPWHDIELPSAGELAEFPVVIEIPRGSKVKYSIDLEGGFLRVDCILFSSMHYPANYGIVPRSLDPGESDPLDVLVLGQEPIVPLAVLHARAIGGFRMRDEMGDNDKIIAVHVHDPAFSEYHDIAELPRHVAVEIRHFFEDYKAQEGIAAHVGEPLDRAQAVDIVRACAGRYERRKRSGRAARER